MNNPQTIFLSIVISIAVFLLLREVFCWYFKINKRLSVLLDIKAELVKANNYSNPNKEPALLNHPNDVSVDGGGCGGASGYGYADESNESFWRAK
jgi:hypothetical protein